MPTFEIVLFNPEIPPNTGNIMRLCANTGCTLHIIKPISFELNEKSLRRAGMDYLKHIQTKVYNNIDHFMEKNSKKNFFLVTKFGKNSYEELKYKLGDCFIFGSESKGLPKKILDKFRNFPKIYIPMIPGNRSLNLANSVSICIYEAWRQNNFQPLKTKK